LGLYLLPAGRTIINEDDEDDHVSYYHNTVDHLPVHQALLEPGTPHGTCTRTNPADRSSRRVDDSHENPDCIHQGLSNIIIEISRLNYNKYLMG